jgi:hypothetical protein
MLFIIISATIIEDIAIAVMKQVTFSDKTDCHS